MAASPALASNSDTMSLSRSRAPLAGATQSGGHNHPTHAPVDGGRGIGLLSRRAVTVGICLCRRGMPIAASAERAASCGTLRRAGPRGLRSVRESHSQCALRCDSQPLAERLKGVAIAPALATGEERRPARRLLGARIAITRPRRAITPGNRWREPSAAQPCGYTRPLFGTRSANSKGAMGMQPLQHS
jgi:hypothetical protein